MSHGTAVVASALVLLLLVLSLATAALAQTSPNYDLEWHVIGGGGQAISSASYAVNSTVGQGAASPPLSVSASYAVSGGYWTSSSALAYHQVYLPLVLKGY